jgi:hypothetical protein
MIAFLILAALFGLWALTPTSEPSDQSEPARLRPPALELRSEAGTQRAVQGSYCVEGVDSGECAEFEAPVVPTRASVVRPGEVVTLAFAGADSVDGTASVRRLGCDEVLLTVPLEPETRWPVELEPGAYELLAEVVTFEAGNVSGDTTAVLGLVVDAEEPLEVRPAGRPAACPAR